MAGATINVFVGIVQAGVTVELYSHKAGLASPVYAVSDSSGNCSFSSVGLGSYFVKADLRNIPIGTANSGFIYASNPLKVDSDGSSTFSVAFAPPVNPSTTAVAVRV
jgi:hypothetical protein